jgi:hypothetical protein
MIDSRAGVPDDSASAPPEKKAPPPPLTPVGAAEDGVPPPLKRCLLRPPGDARRCELGDDEPRSCGANALAGVMNAASLVSWPATRGGESARGPDEVGVMDDASDRTETGCNQTTWIEPHNRHRTHHSRQLDDGDKQQQKLQQLPAGTACLTRRHAHTDQPQRSVTVGHSAIQQ